MLNIFNRNICYLMIRQKMFYLHVENRDTTYDWQARIKLYYIHDFCYLPAFLCCETGEPFLIYCITKGEWYIKEWAVSLALSATAIKMLYPSVCYCRFVCDESLSCEPMAAYWRVKLLDESKKGFVRVVFQVAVRQCYHQRAPHWLPLQVTGWTDETMTTVWKTNVNLTLFLA